METNGKGGATQLEATSHGGTRINRPALWELLEKQSFQCALTGSDLTPAIASLDHCIPLSRGGLNAMENVQIIRIDVNAAKGSMTTEEFVAMCCEVADYIRSIGRPTINHKGTSR